MSPVKSSQPEINLSSMTLKEKIAQMIIVDTKTYEPSLVNLEVGGLLLSGNLNESEYEELINRYQNNSKIKLFISADLEGYWNPFSFYKSKSLGDVGVKEAHDLGKEHGQILKELGFNLDFSPVVEVKNNVWPGRSFTGTEKEIKQKISGYINGLQDQGILATAKHYPGGNLEKNPHWFKVHTILSKEDLSFFDEAIKNNISAVMVGHTIVSGARDSNKKQSTVSEEVISQLRTDFDGLIIADAIGMWGLRISYLFNSKKLYVDLVKAGNDLIIEGFFFTSPTRRINSGINAIERAVKNGEISENRVDNSVKRILQAKGYKVTS